MKKGFIFAAVSVVLPILLFACGGGSAEDGSGATNVVDNSVKVPEVPNAPIVSVLSSSSLRISWNDVSSATSYKVFRDSVVDPVSETPTTSYINSRLNRMTTYSYAISACNPGGCSAKSAASSATTEYFAKDNAGRLIISDNEELAYISTNAVTLADNYILTADIDLSAVPNWQPIGNSSNKFTGVLDGNGFIVQGITTSGYAYSGLFGYMEGAVIRNLMIMANDIASSSNNSFTGGLVGYAKESSVSNSYVLLQGNISSFSSGSIAYVGGLIGHAAESDIENSYAFLQGNISSFSSGSAAYTGGLVGYANRGSISNSFAMVEDNVFSRAANAVSSQNTLPLSASAGGLAGYADNSFITNSYSIVQDDILAHSNSNSSSGGLIGYADNSTISNSYSVVEGSISTSGIISFSGGLVGGYKGNTTIGNSYYNASRKLSEGSFTNSNGTAQTLVELRALNATVTNAFAAATANEYDTGWDETIWNFSTDEIFPILRTNPSIGPPRFAHVSSTSLRVSWNRVIGASFYKVLKNSTIVATVNARSSNPLVYSLTEFGLEGGTSFSYAIRACSDKYCFAESPVASQTTKPFVLATSPAGYAEALDIDEFIFSSNSTDEWFSQTELTFDGEDAVQSPDIGIDGITCLATIIDTDKVGPGRLNYYFKISSGGFHKFYIYIDGEEVRQYSGDIDWTLQTHDFISGTYAISWCYEKNVNVAGEPGTVLLDNFTYTSDLISPSPKLDVATSSSLSILWDKVLGATFYEVFRDDIFTANVTIPRSDNTFVYSHTDIGLASDTPYSYAIKACNDKDCFKISPEVSNVTKPFVLENSPAAYSSALDIDIFTFSSTTSAEWFTQTDETQYGVDALQSADIGGRENTCLATIIDADVVGEGRLSYYFKVSSEKKFDNLIITINGIEVNRYSGEVDWTLQTHDFTTGANTIEWCYTKDGIMDSGSDAVFLDNFSYTVNGLISPTPRFGDVTSSAINILWGKKLGATFYEVLRDGVSVANVTTPSPANRSIYSYADIGLADSTSYSYLIRACNNYDCLINAPAASESTKPFIAENSPAEYSRALDIDTFRFSSTTSDEWFSQNIETLTGNDALRSAAIGAFGNSCLATIIDTDAVGPGQLSYYFKVSSEKEFDNLIITINGIEVGRHSGEVDWTLQNIDFTTGVNTVEWCYTKNGISEGEEDAAFLDGFTYTSSSLSVRIYDASSSSLSLRWSENSEATFYKIFRDDVFIADVTMPDPDYSYLYLYRDIGLEGGTSYSYVIRACNDRGCFAKSPTLSGATNSFVSESSSAAYSRALDIDVFTFASATSDEWFNQNTTTQDGIDALQSDKVGGYGSTCLTTVIDTDVIGPGTLDYYLKVSSEEGSDYLTITINNEIVGRYSGEVNWTLQHHNFATGSHTFEWCYRKGFVVSEGLDAAFLDSFSYTSDLASVSLMPGDVTSSALNILWDKVLGATFYEVFRDGVFVANVTMSAPTNPLVYSYADIGLVSGTSYSYAVRACNNYYCSTDSVLLHRATKSFSSENSPSAYSIALDIYDFTFSSTTSDEWFIQNSITRDGVDALQSADIENNEETCLATIIDTDTVGGGGGRLSYYFKVSSEERGDHLTISINGREVRRYSGTMDWTLQTHNFMAGTHTIEWCYTKNGSNKRGSDAVFLDNFSYTLNLLAPILSEVSSSSLRVSWDSVVGATFYKVFRDGVFVADVNTRFTNALVYSYTDIGLDSGTSYSYTIRACDDKHCFAKSPSASESTKSLALESSPAAYSSALDTSIFTFSSNSTDEWFSQTDLTRDSADALQSADIGPYGYSCLTTIIDADVLGAGRLNYYFMISSEEKSNFTIIINGVEVRRHSGNMPWTLQTHNFIAGTHTISWCYNKDGSDNSVLDAVFLDNFSYNVINLISPTPRFGTATSSALEVRWDKVFGATFYEVFRDDVFIANITMLDPAYPYYTDLGLVGGRLYSYMIRACNNVICLAESPAASESTKPLVLENSPAAYSSALDIDTFTFSSTTINEWFNQTGETQDSEDALQSANIRGSGNTCLATRIDTDVVGGGQLSYYFKVSSEKNFDHLIITINGKEVGRYSGEVDWTLQTYDLITGTYTIEWCYTKDRLVNKGLDVVFLDNFSYILSPFSPRFGDAGSSVLNILWNKVLGATSYEVLRDGVSIANITMPSNDNPSIYSYSDIGLASNSSYYYTIRACNNDNCFSDSSVESQATEELSTENSPAAYSSALDIDGFTFLSTTAAEWFNQTDETQDGMDALRSADIGDGGNTCLATTIDTDVAGSGRLRYYFKVSSEERFDHLTISINGVEIRRYSGEVDWTLQTHDLITGAYDIEWCYTKDGSDNSGLDTIFLDNFSYISNDLLSPRPRFGSAGSSGFNILWDRKMDTIFNATFYELLRDGIPVAKVTMPDPDNSLIYSYIDIGLAGGTSYSYAIRACNNNCLPVSFSTSRATKPFVLESSPAAYSSALDIGTFTFSSTTSDEWLNQTSETLDGTDAVQSADIGDNEATCLATRIDTDAASGSGQLSYYFKVSSEMGLDNLIIRVNGTEVGQHSGEVDWTLQTHDFMSGVHTVEWCYRKNGSDKEGLDAVFLDNFSYTLNSLAPSFSEISSSSLRVSWDEVIGASFYEVLRGNLSVANVTMPDLDSSFTYSYTDIGLAGGILYPYIIRACNDNGCFGVGTAASQVTRPFVLENSPAAYSSALDIDNFTFSSTTSGEWFNQIGETQDGVDALQSADIGNDEVTCLVTRIDADATGGRGGQLSYYFKVSSDEGFDNLTISVDGMEVRRYSGEVDWDVQTHDFRTGVHTVEWCYRKDGGGDAGADAAYLDNFSYTVPIPSP